MQVNRCGKRNVLNGRGGSEEMEEVLRYLVRRNIKLEECVASLLEKLENGNTTDPPPLSEATQSRRCSGAIAPFPLLEGKEVPMTVSHSEDSTPSTTAVTQVFRGVPDPLPQQPPPPSFSHLHDVPPIRDSVEPITASSPFGSAPGESSVRPAASLLPHSAAETRSRSSVEKIVAEAVRRVWAQIQEPLTQEIVASVRHSSIQQHHSLLVDKSPCMTPLPVGAAAEKEDPPARGELCSACQQEVAAHFMATRGWKRHVDSPSSQRDQSMTKRAAALTGSTRRGLKISLNDSTTSTNCEGLTTSSTRLPASLPQNRTVGISRSDDKADAAFRVLFDTFSVDHVTDVSSRSISASPSYLGRAKSSFAAKTERRTPLRPSAMSSSCVSRVFPTISRRAKEASVSDLMELRELLEGPLDGGRASF